MQNVPNELKYTKSHEWVRVEEGVAIIGITDFAQSELGDIVYVDLPQAGRVVGAGDRVGSVESVKTVSDLYSPVAGEIIEVNESLGSQSERVNEDPYGEGWMFKMNVTGGMDVLLDSATYKSLIS